MNKKEIAEIKKQFSPVNCNIQRIASCCITAEKEVLPQKVEAFLSLSEEKAFQYFDLFKGALTGKVGEALYTINVPTVNGGCDEWKMVEDLWKSQLMDESLLNEFYEMVKTTYHYNENYMIILINGLYDVPAGNDSGDSVYDYIHCIICPIDLSKASLAFDRSENSIQDGIRQRLVGKAMTGILYPAFHDRAEDLNAFLYFEKKSRQDDLIKAVSGSEMPYTNDELKTGFKTAAESTEEAYTLDTAKALSDIVTDAGEAMDDITIKELSESLEIRGIESGTCSKLEKALTGIVGENTRIPIPVLGNQKKAVIVTPEMKITTEADYLQQVRVMRIDGRLCLVLPVSDKTAEINGITTLLQ